MKAVEFGKAAASAEVQLLQSVAVRYALQIAFLVVAALFVLFALLSAHVTLWVLCYGPWHTGKVWASFIVLGADVALALIFVLLGRGRRPSVAEIEARMRRNQNLAAMKSAMAFSAIAATIAGPAGRMARRGVMDLIMGRMGRRDRRR